MTTLLDMQSNHFLSFFDAFFSLNWENLKFFETETFYLRNVAILRWLLGMENKRWTKTF
jgi:hypothetical protein